MNTFVTNAIVGTGQQRPETITTNTSVDSLVEHLPADDVERKLLLAAGAWSVYQRAGYSAQHFSLDTDVAPDETVPTCSSKIADLIATMLSREYADLLPEALERLQQVGLRLPYKLLPEILSYGSEKSEIQAALISVLGERGRWLSLHKPQWSWVAQFLNESRDTLPPDVETVWQEGTLRQRKGMLRLLRIAEPDRAREWLMDVWKKETPGTRRALLSTFDTGISFTDEPFLEIARNDRDEHVQHLAISLLVRIPTSALARHIVALIDPMISYSRKKSISAKNMTLMVHIPAIINAKWERLSPEKKPGSLQMSDEQWCLQQVIALVAPQHWEERFSASADELLAGTHSIDEQFILINAWTKAALLHNASHWYAPLCTWWLRQKTSNWSHALQDRQSIVLSLFQRLTPSEAEHILLPLINSHVDNWTYLFLAMPTPCSHEFGIAILKALQQYAGIHKADSHYDYLHWAHIIPYIAKVLPPTCFERASALWPPPDPDAWTNYQLRTLLPSFIKQIELRKELLEELG